MSNNKILPETIILSPLLCFSKKSVFEEIADCISQRCDYTQRQIINILNIREQHGSTVCAKGVAMPSALIPELEQDLMILAVLKDEVPFNTVDTEMAHVDLVFAFFLKDLDKIEEYEDMLATLSSMIAKHDICDALRKVKNDRIKLRLNLNRIDNLLYSKYHKENLSE